MRAAALTASSSIGSCSACSTGGMRCLASRSRCFRSSRMCSLWFLLMKEVAMPVLPLRPARQARAGRQQHRGSHGEEQGGVRRAQDMLALVPAGDCVSVATPVIQLGGADWWVTGGRQMLSMQQQLPTQPLPATQRPARMRWFDASATPRVGSPVRPMRCT